MGDGGEASLALIGCASRLVCMGPRLTFEAVEAMVAASVTVRRAFPEDARAVDRLAQLDSGQVPTGPTLVAEVRGELVAALPLGGGRPVADPLRPTAELVGLLELRAAQLNGDDGRHRRPLGPTRRTGLRPQVG